MFDYIIVALLLSFSALFSGLTLGLMSLNTHELKRKMSLGNRQAQKIYAVRKRGNLLLTTLLIGNVAINSTLAIFLGSIAEGFTAGLIATSLIVVFGEIIPQAIFARFALFLGAKLAWLVKILIFVFYPIASPIAWMLDKILSEELAAIYSKKELMKIVEEHGGSKNSDLDADEERIIKGALSYSDTLVEDVMTPKTVVQLMNATQIIDDEFLNSFESSTYSRIPVFQNSEDNIVGILYVMRLLGQKHIGKTVAEVMDKKVTFVDEDSKLDVVFNLFIKSHHHLFIVRNEFGAITGVISLEDILEEIIKTEIIDEVDKHPDLRKLALQRRG